MTRSGAWKTFLSLLSFLPSFFLPSLLRSLSCSFLPYSFLPFLLSFFLGFSFPSSFSISLQKISFSGFSAGHLGRVAQQQVLRFLLCSPGCTPTSLWPHGFVVLFKCVEQLPFPLIFAFVISVSVKALQQNQTTERRAKDGTWEKAEIRIVAHVIPEQ